MFSYIKKNDVSYIVVNFIPIPRFIPMPFHHSVPRFIPIPFCVLSPFCSAFYPHSVPPFRSRFYPYSVPLFRSTFYPHSVPLFLSAFYPHSVPPFRFAFYPHSVMPFRSVPPFSHSGSAFYPNPTYCLETEKDWDYGIHLLLFAARESVQESLGFSPFELVFGHRVRGPLLKEKLVSTEDGSLNLLEYVSNFRTRLTKACDLARKNLKSAQNRTKQNYDKNSVTRKFQQGDKVLAFLPVSRKPLQARYSGLYVGEKRESELNYVIVTSDRRKHKQLFHVNMLKPYNERKKVVMSVESADNDTYSVNEDLFNLSESTKSKNSDIFNNLDDNVKIPRRFYKNMKNYFQTFPREQMRFTTT